MEAMFKAWTAAQAPANPTPTPRTGGGNKQKPNLEPTTFLMTKGMVKELVGDTQILPVTVLHTDTTSNQTTTAETVLTEVISTMN